MGQTKGNRGFGNRGEDGSSMTEHMVYFFEEAGAENTGHLIEAVKHRIRQGGVGKVLVASKVEGWRREFEPEGLRPLQGVGLQLKA